jgi:hypothetical protein
MPRKFQEVKYIISLFCHYNYDREPQMQIGRRRDCVERNTGQHKYAKCDPHLAGATRQLVPPGGLDYWVASVLHDAGDAQRRGPDPPDPGTVSPTANMRERKLHPDAHNAPTCGQLPRFGSLCCGPR